MFQIIRADITKFHADAVVNAANSSLLGGGGVDGAIHKAAGPALLAECRTLGGCKTGQAKATAGYNMDCKYIIHTVGPIWHGGKHGEEDLLRSCYRNSLCLALELGCESIAFPLISSGAYRYPWDQAMSVAMDEFRLFLEENEMEISLVIYGGRPSLPRDLKREIDQLLSPPVSVFRKAMPGKAMGSISLRNAARSDDAYGLEDALSMEAPLDIDPELSSILGRRDESFSQTLLRLIDERELTDVEAYKRSNIDRKLFSKIRSDPDYRPKKATACAFAVGLRLDLDETAMLLDRAGYSLSDSLVFDKIVRYFIGRGSYDIYLINSVLFAYDQVLLGAGARGGE